MKKTLINTLFISILVALYACGEGDTNKANISTEMTQEKPEVVDASRKSWDAHIQSPPPTLISALGPFSIHFAHPVLNEDTVINESVEGVVIIEPQVEAKISFASDRELLIEFPKALDRSLDYHVTVFPNKLAGVRESLPPYRFKIKPYQQDFGVQVDGLRGSNNGKEFTIDGKVTTNDADQIKAIEQLITATQLGRALTINWQHSSAQNHQFTISGITRESTNSRVNIQWQGQSIQVDKSGGLTVDVPPLNRFEALGALSKYIKDGYIEVNFSEALDRNQSFQGLVKINDTDTNNVRVSGNTLRIYPHKKLNGKVIVTVYQGIKSSKKQRTDSNFSKELMILTKNPGIRFHNDSYILPEASTITVPIEAVNVDSVQIIAYKLDSKNLSQFIQSNNMRSSRQPLVTTSLWKKTYQLPEIPKDEWMRFDLDVTNNFKNINNDLLAFEIKINRSNSIFECSDKRPLPDDNLKEDNAWPFVNNDSNPDWVSKYYYSSGHYVWRDNENPCKDQFYNYYKNSTQAFRYLHQSNVGLIAKMGVDRSMLVVATDIKTAQPLRDVNVIAYNLQHQPVATGLTNAEGILRFTPISAPFYLLAEHQEDLGFLRLQRNEALSTNVFDIGGEKANSGIKGFFYGERGVWRPGDSIYLTFIAHDKTGTFPKNYPLTIDFFDPKGNKFDSITNANPLDGFYHYQLITNEDSPTGNWRAVIRYGGEYFSKVIPIETIKPNRLKIDLEFPEQELVYTGRAIDVGLFSQWLNGATANQLRADVEMNITGMETTIAGYDSYVFDDPARELQPSKQNIFDGQLDEEGRAKFSLRPNVYNVPGKLKLNFTTRVFEKSGNFSIQYTSIPFMPYEELVGINVPNGSGWNNSIARDEVHPISLILLNNRGKPIANNDINLQVYRIGWRWWWDSGSDSIASYVSSSYNNRLVNLNLKTDNNGRAQWELDGKEYDWGRYLIRACHVSSSQGKNQHCSGKVVYLGWSYNQQKNPSGDTQLMLSTDKDRYQVGDLAKLTIPSMVNENGDNAKVLLTIESGTKILSQRWIENDIQESHFDLNLTEDMTPNVYAHVTVLQGYDNKTNDSPIRLYGIVPLLVDDEKTQLAPMITAPEEVRPQSQLNLRVSEANGKAMTYTLAIVDEGLLGITNYRTPDPYKTLFKREALGVMTWDLYDLVSKSSAFDIDRLLSIGGSDQGKESDGTKKKRRFPPVVKFIGPFNLAAGQNENHSIQLPNYMGAVRVMLVAGNTNQAVGAYGKAEKTIRVTQPLTVFATLPRVLGPGESVKLPVNVFVNNNEIKDVDIRIETNEFFLSQEKSATLNFSQSGDKIVSLDLTTIDAIGLGQVKVSARSGKEVASQEINIDIRSANLPQTISETAVLQPGEERILSLTPIGMENTNNTYLEVSRVPQIDLEGRLRYLLGYPHGCLEQTTSKLFPQIYLSKLTTLSEKQKIDIDRNIREGMRKYANFQTAKGDFNYWPGGSYSNQWSNNYAGHFLIEAKKIGYTVPESLFNNWLNAQKEHAKKTGDKRGYESTDAYTLYTLALADVADFNAMNRLKERLASMKKRTNDNHKVARWMLASAYAHAGVQDAALELLDMSDNQPEKYQWPGYTYGSSLRDTALLTMTYNRTQQETRAWEIAQSMAEDLSKTSWYSTHSLAWSLMALSDFFAADDQDKAHPFRWQVNQQAAERTQFLSPIYKQTLDYQGNRSVSVTLKNEGEKALYVLLGNQGVPANQKEVASSSNVSIGIDFQTMEGEPLDVSRLPQGEDFKARVTVNATDRYARLENLALTMITPSGWEISNDRMKDLALPQQIEYQDIRDDRVLSYFALGNYYWWHRNNRREVTIELTLNPTYAGRFYLPGWHVESMYDKDIAANTLGQWVEVISPE